MPDEIIDSGSERARHRDLFGRDDVLEQLEAWLFSSRAESGYILLTGGPGLGKSALLSRLLDRAESRGISAPHHFLRRGANRPDQSEELQISLAAQIEDLFPAQRDADDVDDGHLLRLLQRVATQVLQPGSGRLIMVIDGLDEIRADRDNPLPLFLPAEAPKGLYVVCSARPDYAHLRWLQERPGVHSLDLSGARWAPSNAAAVRAFWAHTAPRFDPPLSQEFVAEAVRRAEGNLLHAVMLRELLSGLHPRDRQEASLDQIPRGIEGFLYALQAVIHPISADSLGDSLEGLPERLKYDEMRESSLRDTRLRPGPAGLRSAERAALTRAAREESPHWRRDPQKMPQLVARRLRQDGWSEAQLAALLPSVHGAAAQVASLPEQTLVGHSSPVKACAVTPDGRYAISGSDDRTLRVWDLQTGQTVRALVGHSSPVKACAVTHDGTVLVSASADQTLKVWDLRTGRALRTLSGHQAPVWACAITPDGQRVVSASADHSLRVWEIATGKALASFVGHLEPVWACAITPDGTRAISGSADHTLRVWDLVKREVVTLRGHLGPVLGCTVTADSAFLVSASADRTLRVWDLKKGDEVFTLTGHKSTVIACAVSPDGGRVVSASEDRTLKIWDLKRGQEIVTLRGHEGAVSACAVTPDGQQVISASDDRTLRIWDLTGGKELACSVTPDGQQVLSSWDSNDMKLWELNTGREVATLDGHAAPVLDCVVMPDGNYAVSRSADDKLKVWDLRARRCVDTAQGVGDFLFFASNRDRDASTRAWMMYSSAPVPEASPAAAGEAGSRRSLGPSRDTTYGGAPVALIGAGAVPGASGATGNGAGAGSSSGGRGEPLLTPAPPSATPILSLPLHLMASLKPPPGVTASLLPGEVPMPTRESLQSLLLTVLQEECDVDEFFEDYFAELWAGLDPGLDRRGKLQALCDHVPPIEIVQRLSEYDREAVAQSEYLLEYR